MALCFDNMNIFWFFDNGLGIGNYVSYPQLWTTNRVDWVDFLVNWEQEIKDLFVLGFGEGLLDQTAWMADCNRYWNAVYELVQLFILDIHELLKRLSVLRIAERFVKTYSEWKIIQSDFLHHLNDNLFRLIFLESTLLLDWVQSILGLFN